MGRAKHANLKALSERYGLTTFVETGTGWGVSVCDALEVERLRTVISIEIDPEVWARNRAQFAHEPRVVLLLGDSRMVLPTLVQALTSSPVCWFLDAHFPGSAREVPVPMLPLALAPNDAVPLEEELAAIVNGRDTSRDVFIVDDRCLFESDTYAASNSNGSDGVEFRNALRLATAEQFLTHLGATHDIQRSTVDMGYLICIPADLNNTPQ